MCSGSAYGLQAERGVLDRPQQDDRKEQVPVATRDVQLDGYDSQVCHQDYPRLLPSFAGEL